VSAEEETVTTPSTRTNVVIRTYGPGKVPPMLDVLADLSGEYRNTPDGPAFDLLLLRVEDVD
jgi:hypothetical protein